MSSYAKVALVLAILVITFVTLIVTDIIKQTKSRNLMHDKCFKTNLYTVERNGHKNRIYNCTGIELEETK